jgi:thymidylate synthase (FAD)
MPSDDLQSIVAYCARVSNPDNQLSKDNQRLIDYLIEHKHWSPFEMVSATLEVVTTRDIARQMLRHRSFSFQEFSQRYSSKFAKADPRECRMQDTKNRQNSTPCDDDLLSNIWERMQQDTASMCLLAYEYAISHGIAKEVARAVLPEGLTQSRLYVAGTLRSWLHYCDVRCGPETQKEHREVARACASELSKHFAYFAKFCA